MFSWECSFQPFGFKWSKHKTPFTSGADGSIDPPTANITTFDNITYSFKGNIYDSVVVERNNIVVDSAGYALQGNGSGTGLYLSNRNHVTIKNMNISMFITGVYLSESSSNMIVNNEIAGCGSHAIRLHSIWGSSNLNAIQNNTLSNGGSGIYFSCDANYMGDLSNNSIAYNVIRNFENGIFLNPNYQIQSQMEYNTFGYNNVTNCTTAIRINPTNGYCTVRYNTFYDNILRDGQYGFYLDEWYGRNIEVYSNNFTDNKLTNFSSYGVFFANSETYDNDFGGSNTLNGNNFYHYAYLQNDIVSDLHLNSSNDGTNLGLFTLAFSQNVTLKDSTLSGDRESGLFLWGSNNNTIVNNNITANPIGILLSYSNNNSIHHNFFNNTNQVQVTSGSANTWDDGYPSGGNYWNGYSDSNIYSGPYQNETESDNIWDHPYIIDANNRDNYPIVPEFSAIIVIPLSMIATFMAAIAYRRKRFER